MVVLSSIQVIVPGVGEMAQWVRVLAVQAWVPSTHEENWVYMCACACIPSISGLREVDPSSSWPSRLAETAGFWFTKRLCLREVAWRRRGHWKSGSGLHMGMQTNPHTCACALPY